MHFVGYGEFMESPERQRTGTIALCLSAMRIQRGDAFRLPHTLLLSFRTCAERLPHCSDFLFINKNASVMSLPVGCLGKWDE